LDTGEDRIIKKAKEEKKHPMEIAEFYLKHWLEVMEKLKIQKPDLMPRATEHIKEIIEQVKTLIKNGYAYVTTEGNVYFEVSKFNDYGKLSKRVPKELIAGARVEVAKDKKDPRDFALWIRAKPEHILKWESPWGIGFPGWHIEDTAIALKYFGPQYDIHGGAIELAFPHHEAEIAQAEGTTGVKPYVKYWVHTGLLTINGVKMSKSLGNIIPVFEALKKYSAETIRLWIASTHYRKPLDYNERDLEVAKKKVEKIYNVLRRIRETKATSKKSTLKKDLKEFRKKFFEAMLDDVNSPLALTYFFKMISVINKRIDEGNVSKEDLENAEKTIRELGDFFQIIPEIKEVELPEEAKKLIDEREEARKRKDYATADKIRERLEKEFGIILEDTSEGVKWRLK
jgi:cysteinyl-tRNA synthetase